MSFVFAKFPSRNVRHSFRYFRLGQNNKFHLEAADFFANYVNETSRLICISSCAWFVDKSKCRFVSEIAEILKPFSKWLRLNADLFHSSKERQQATIYSLFNLILIRSVYSIFKL